LETELKIVIVENNPDDQHMIKYAFRETGASPELVFIESGMGLIEHLDVAEPEDHPSLIVLDHNMPELDGIETLHRIKDNPFTKHIPVVIYTTGVSVNTKQKLKEIGALLVVEKGDGLPKLIEQAKFFIELIIGA
jgi:CheY-like chemotaxis protein